jgi:hypothetical protein
MNFAKETLRRLTLSTPSYFRKLIYFGITLGTIGAGFVTIPELSFLHELGEVLIAIGLACSVVAKAAVKDTNHI